jgi:hypothetical protein
MSLRRRLFAWLLAGEIDPCLGVLLASSASTITSSTTKFSVLVLGAQAARAELLGRRSRSSAWRRPRTEETAKCMCNVVDIV